MSQCVALLVEAECVGGPTIFPLFTGSQPRTRFFTTTPIPVTPQSPGPCCFEGLSLGLGPSRLLSSGCGLCLEATT